MVLRGSRLRGPTLSLLGSASGPVTAQGEPACWARQAGLPGPQSRQTFLYLEGKCLRPPALGQACTAAAPSSCGILHLCLFLVSGLESCRPLVWGVTTKLSIHIQKLRV